MKADTNTWFKGALYLSFAFFCLLMLQITGKYIPWGTDIAFLQIKQTEVQTFTYYLPFFYMHVYSAIFCLPAGFTQFNNKLLQRNKKVHRIIGYVYVVTVLLLAAPSGLVIGWHANGGPVAILFFSMLAVLWFWFTLKALLTAKNGQYKAHKYYMMRSFALALSAITLRLYKVIIVKIWAPPPMDVYVLVSGLSWIPNLLFVEFLIRYRAAKRKVYI